MYFTESTHLVWSHCVLWIGAVEWFDTAFNILTVNIVLLIICCCLLIVCTCFAYAARYKIEAPVKKDRAALILLYISLLLLILSSTCIHYSVSFVHTFVLLFIFLPSFWSKIVKYSVDIYIFLFMDSWNQCMFNSFKEMTEHKKTKIRSRAHEQKSVYACTVRTINFECLGLQTLCLAQWYTFMILGLGQLLRSWGWGEGHSSKKALRNLLALFILLYSQRCIPCRSDECGWYCNIH